MSIHDDYILGLEKLANSCLKRSNYYIDKAIKSMANKGENEKETQALIAALVALIGRYISRALLLSKDKNGVIGLGGEPTVDPELPINGETIEDRVAKYVTDLKANVTKFKEEDDPKLVALGIALLKVPYYRALELDRHRELVVEGKRGAASSAAFLSNIERNIFGNIFYAGRLADSSVWKINPLRAIEVVTQGDHLVCEQCKAMAGLYPPDYIFAGNHPKCRCTAIPRILGTKVRRISSHILDYAKANKKKFGKLMIYTLNSKYYG